MQTEFDSIIKASLEEDAPFGDVTTSCTIAAGTQAKGVFRAKEDGVLCGTGIAERTFELSGGGVCFTKLFNDGDEIRRGDIIARDLGRRGDDTFRRGERPLTLCSALPASRTATRAAMRALKGCTHA